MKQYSVPLARPGVCYESIFQTNLFGFEQLPTGPGKKNKQIIKYWVFTEGIGAIFTHLTKSSLEQFLTQTFWVN